MPRYLAISETTTLSMPALCSSRRRRFLHFLVLNISTPPLHDLHDVFESTRSLKQLILPMNRVSDNDLQNVGPVDTRNLQYHSSLFTYDLRALTSGVQHGL